MNNLSVFLEKNKDKYIAIRRYLHQHPEVGMETPKTSHLIANMLEEFGYSVSHNIAGHGVVGSLSNGNSNLSLGIRADIDALPMQEKTNLAWESINNNMFHGCGHDGHTAMLLLAADYLSQHKDFNGTVNLIFQPGEELLYGGKLMIDDGLFDKYPCDYIFALHNMPGLKEGTFNFCKKEMMASSDTLEITINGKGGHGAIPEKTIDAGMIACYIVTSIQTIISRNVSPFERAVITVGSINAGTVANIISDTAKLKISMRSLNQETRDILLERTKKLIQLQAESFGATAEIEIITSCPVLYNNEEYTDLSIEIAEKVVDKKDINKNIKPMMGSEDFSYMLNTIKKGNYCFIGAGDASECHMVHNSKYDFNDNLITLGAKYWCTLVKSILK